MSESDRYPEMPLTASLDPAGNIGTAKALMTGRIHAYVGAGPKDILPPAFPWTVGVSPTSRCPRACFFCSHATRNRLGHYLSEKTMCRVHDCLRTIGARGIIYAGGGDPLAWEHGIVPFIELATGFCDVGIDTNGVLAGRLIASPAAQRVFYVTISLLAHERRLYREICGRDQFDIVDRNIRAFAALKSRSADGRPRVNVKLSVNRRSYRHFAAMCRYARGLGADNVFARCMNDFEIGQDIELNEAQKRELYCATMRDCGLPDGYAEPFARNLVYPPQLPADMCAPSRCWSVILGHNLGIKPDGECYLCVPTTGRPEFSIGNVNRRPLDALWGGARHLEVMRRLDDRMRRGGCDPNRCRHHRLNLVLERALRGGFETPSASMHDTLHASFL